MATAGFREDIVRCLRQMQDAIREVGAKCIVLSVPDGAARRARIESRCAQPAALLRQPSLLTHLHHA